MPPRYDAERGQIVSETIKFLNNSISGTNETTQTYPQKHWLDNVGFEITNFVVYNLHSPRTNSKVAKRRTTGSSKSFNNIRMNRMDLKSLIEPTTLSAC